MQFGVLGINAVSRQAVEDAQLLPYYNLVKQPEEVQWSPLLLFVIIFVLGLLVVAWMIAQVAKLPPEGEAV